MLNKLAESIRRKPIYGWLLFAAFMVVVFMLGLLSASITERRAEIATLFNNKKIHFEGINPKSEEWGLNYPREYNTWVKTKEMDFKSKHLGNVAEDVLATRPAMVVL